MKLTSIQIKKMQGYFAKQKDVLAVYLYGSFAKGTTHKRSDLDIAVLFSKPVNLYNRLGQIYSDLCDLELPAEPEARELDLNQSPVYLKNVISGKLVYSSDEIKRVRFEVEVANILRDTEYFRKLKYYYINRSLKEGTYGHRLLHN